MKKRGVLLGLAIMGWAGAAFGQDAAAVEPDEAAVGEEPATEDDGVEVEALATGVSETTTASGPVVWLIPKKEDLSRGVMKLGQHHNSTAQRVGESVLITTTYKEICTAPCGVPVDVSERPVFYIVRDGVPITKPFRLNDVQGDVTIRVKPQKTGMVVAGIITTSFLLFPIGIPLMIAGKHKLWIAPGTPEQHGEWVKLRRAKF